MPDPVVIGEARGANWGEWAAPTAADMALTLFESLRGCRPGWLRGDCLAGLTVWAVLVPESLAYASIAGVRDVLGTSAPNEYRSVQEAVAAVRARPPDPRAPASAKAPKPAKAAKAEENPMGSAT